MNNCYYVYLVQRAQGAPLRCGVAENRERLLARLNKSLKSDNALQQLVWFETTSDADSAFARQAEVKRMSAAKKRKLVQSLNPDWWDLQQDDLITRLKRHP